MDRIVPILKAMSQLVVHAETFVRQGTLVLMGLVHVQQVRHPMGLVSAQQGIYYAMEHVSIKPLMITIAVSAEMLVSVDHFALRELVSLIPT